METPAAIKIESYREYTSQLSTWSLDRDEMYNYHLTLTFPYDLQLSHLDILALLSTLINNLTIVIYKYGIGKHKNGQYHIHLFIGSPLRIEYSSLRKEWPYNSWVTTAYNIPDLFNYIGNHRIFNDKNTYGYCPLDMLDSHYVKTIEK